VQALEVFVAVFNELQGFEAIKQLLSQTDQPYKFILGARDKVKTKEAYEALDYSSSLHKIAILPLDLSDLETVKSFAQQALDRLDQDELNYLFLNAAANHGKEERANKGNSRWTESYIVNHLAHHYLVHLLREKLVASKSRVIFTSSGAATLGEPGKDIPQ
jgi:NAD(P)-dependent dehydrogenase (short-subunit alcohol dehydrogenase family)